MKDEFGGIGRAYYLVLFLVACMTAITLVVIFTDPKMTGSMLGWYKDFCLTLVVPVIGFKEGGKLIAKKLTQKE